MQTETVKNFTRLFSQTPHAEAGNEQLQQLAQKYPYFAPAQFALAMNLKHEDNFNYLSQLQKTALFFSNTKWLEYLLTDEEEFDGFNISGIGEEISNAKTVPVLSSQIEEKKPDSLDVNEDEQEIPNAKISSVLSSQITEIKKPVDENAKLEFEKNSIPQYTIDYFASQGIIFDPAKFNDNLSKQLMSFTDWLKQMKKNNLHLKQNTITDEVENAIQKIAESSNEIKEVVTETMAHIFIKQGNVEKARNLYLKLSFLYPEKSAYFAAKILELNNK